MARLITVEGTAKDVTPNNGEKFTLAEMQAFVGGLIAPVYLPDGRTILVNDEGLLMGMEINIRASMLAGYPLVGPALLLNEKEWN